MAATTSTTPGTIVFDILERRRAVILSEFTPGRSAVIPGDPTNRYVAWFYGQGPATDATTQHLLADDFTAVGPVEELGERALRMIDVGLGDDATVRANDVRMRASAECARRRTARRGY